MRIRLLALLACALLPVTACDREASDADAGMDAPDGFVLDTDSGQWVPSDGGAIQLVDGGITIMDDGGTFTCYQTLCNGKLLECGDCLDNDGDGRMDWRDQECLGPCDNTEGPELIAGVGGETGGACKSDCYFDFGNGSGNDDCHWDHRCDPLSVAPDFHPEGAECALTESMLGTKECPATQSTQCHDFCRPLTPNGCDCFGCCTFPQLGADKFVWIGSMDESNNGTCTFADINDPAKCEPCTPVADCFNDCGTCELCLGKTELPAECMMTPDAGAPDMTPPPRCEGTLQPCGLLSDPVCAEGFYCVTGCCVDTIIVL